MRILILNRQDKKINDAISFFCQGRFVNHLLKENYSWNSSYSDGKIKAFEEDDSVQGPYILPGFVDAHIHIESSMLVPYEFARIALGHGTVATVSDPHEIANVMG